VWNLCGATDRKWPHVLALRPALAVLPEVARQPKALAGGGLLPPDAEWHWVGTVPSRGLAVATFGMASSPLLVDAGGRWSVGARTAGGLHALGIWSCPSGGGAPAYLLEVRRAIEAHARWLSGPGPRLVAGDLNVMGSGTTATGFRRLADQLAELGLRSAYHAYFDERFGSESRATYFHLRRRERPFHIDFCFLSPELLGRVQRVEVGAYDDWVTGAAGSVSDHVPLVVELAPAAPQPSPTGVAEGRS
jgi:hypothetical protein